MSQLTRTQLLAALLAALAPLPLRGQNISTDSATVIDRGSTARMGTGGLLGAVAGLWLGMRIGERIHEPPADCDECTRWGAAGGGGVGATLGLALGVHLADRARGEFLPVLGRSAAVMGVTWALSWAAYEAGLDINMIVVPAGVAGAIAAAIRAERATLPTRSP